jgi:hypothetical protein
MSDTRRVINIGCLHKKYAYNHCAEMACRNYKEKCPLHCVTGSPIATCNLTRTAVLSGLSDEARETIDKAISLSPALEETILLIAELCFRDGEESCEFGCMPMDHHPESP